MDEHSFRKSFETGIKKRLNWHWKIHDQFAGGVLDAFYEGHKSDLWVEYKWLKLPKRDNTVIDFANPDRYLSKLQQIWIIRRHQLRGDTLVVVGHDEGCILLPALTWQQPMTAAEVKARSSSKKIACDQIDKLIN